MNADIQAPVMKSVTALATTGGTAGYATMQGHIQNFLPVDAIGWVTLLGASLGVLYSLCLLTEWWWKKVWKPLLVRYGWIKARDHIDSTFAVD